MEILVLLFVFLIFVAWLFLVLYVVKKLYDKVERLSMQEDIITYEDDEISF